MEPRQLLSLLLCLGKGYLVSGLSCYVCSEEGSGASDTCGGQWQFDCGAGQGSRKFHPQERLFCRTTLQRHSQNQTYRMEKECVSETQQKRDFPGGRTQGCDRLFDETGFELTYCICNSHLCNFMPLQQQMLTASTDGNANGGGPSQIPNAFLGPTNFVADLPPPRGGPEVATLGSDNAVVIPRLADLGFSNDFAQRYQPVNDAKAPHITPPIPYPVPNPLALLPSPAAPTPDSLGEWTPADLQTEAGVSRLEPAMRLQHQDPVPIDTLFKGYEEAWVPVEESDLLTASVTAAAALATQPLPPPFEPLPDEEFKIRRAYFGEQPTAGSVRGLVCLVCREESGNGTVGSGTGCVEQRAMDCASHYPPGTPTFCFSRDSRLSSGAHVVEKLCVSDYALKVEYGEQVVMTGCSSVWDGRVNYCVCAEDKCNEKSVAAQVKSNGGSMESAEAMATTEESARTAYQPTAFPAPSFALPQSTRLPKNPVPENDSTVPLAPKVSQKCFVCGESNMVNATDCHEKYEYDCGLQYPNEDQVLCLTRLTKLEHEKVAVEKRCITEAQHREQYPGNEVVTDGCGDAWNGYVQYCVCRGQLCNMGDIGYQQGSRPSPAPVTPTLAGSGDLTSTTPFEEETTATTRPHAPTKAQAAPTPPVQTTPLPPPPTKTLAPRQLPPRSEAKKGREGRRTKPLAAVESSATLPILFPILASLIFAHLL